MIRFLTKTDPSTVVQTWRKPNFMTSNIDQFCKKTFLSFSFLMIASVFVFSGIVLGQGVTTETPFELIDEYKISSAGSHKEVFDAFYLVLNQNPSLDGTVRIQSKNNREIVNQFEKFYRGVSFRQYSLERITLAFDNNSGNEKVEFWLNIPKVEIPNCSECFYVRLKDYRKIEQFFKPQAKKRK